MHIHFQQTFFFFLPLLTLQIPMQIASFLFFSTTQLEGRMIIIKILLRIFKHSPFHFLSLIKALAFFFLNIIKRRKRSSVWVNNWRGRSGISIGEKEGCSFDGINSRTSTVMEWPFKPRSLSLLCRFSLSVSLFVRDKCGYVVHFFFLLLYFFIIPATRRHNRFCNLKFFFSLASSNILREDVIAHCFL